MTESLAIKDLGMTGTSAAPAETGLPTPDQIWSMTPDQATQALADMAKQTPAPPPQSPEAARQRLATDTDLLRRYFDGSPEARTEVEQLKARAGEDKYSSMVNGTYRRTGFETSNEHELSVEDTHKAISWFREAGFNNETILEAIENKPIARAIHDEVEQLLAACFRDTEFLKKVAANDPDALLEVGLMKTILARPIEEEA